MLAFGTFIVALIALIV
ncbi:putative holin-like toxin, partial [Lactiplantibacillus paraplantarum]